MAIAEFADELTDADLRQYAELGFAFRHIAELDYQLEAFMLCVSRHEPQFCSHFSKSFPSSFQEKIEFVIVCYQTFSCLRSFGDANGKSDANLLSYGLEEIFSFRNTFFHSATDLIEHLENGFSWNVTRHQRKKETRGIFNRSRYNFGSGYLDRIVDLSRYFTRWFVDAERSMNGENVAEFWNSARKVNSGHYVDLAFRIWETGELP